MNYIFTEVKIRRLNIAAKLEVIILRDDVGVIKNSFAFHIKSKDKTNKFYDCELSAQTKFTAEKSV